MNAEVYIADLPTEERGAGLVTTAAVPGGLGDREDVLPDALTAAQIVAGKVVVGHGCTPGLGQQNCWRHNRTLYAL